MRRLTLLLLLLVSGAFAQDGQLFLPPEEAYFGSMATAGARARFGETLAILKRRVTKDAADGEAWERLAGLLREIGREEELSTHLRNVIDEDAALGDKLLPVRRCHAHLLVKRASVYAPLLLQAQGVIIFRFGNNVDPRKLCKEAVPHLRVVSQANPQDARTKSDLADALEILDKEKHAEEVERLRRAVLALTPPPPEEQLLPDGADRIQEADKLRREAGKLELAKKPDFDKAETMRRRALVLDFCTHTVPFEYDASHFQEIALLADWRLLVTNLTRRYLDAEDREKSVPPDYHAPGLDYQLETAGQLAETRTATATAALLAIMRRTGVQTPLADAALEALAETNPEPLQEHLAQLLAYTLTTNDEEPAFYPHGRRYLVRLVERTGLKRAAPVLRQAVKEDRGLICPLDAAEALAAVGTPEDADLLLEVANDQARDAYFRRRAVDAVARLAPDRIGEIEADLLLALSLAAAGYRTETDEAKRALFKTKILDALGDTHEADDAARYCVALGITDALAKLEEAARARAKDYVGADIRAALQQLRSKS